MHKYMIVGLFALSSSFVMSMQLVVAKKTGSLTPGETVVRRKSDPKHAAAAGILAVQKHQSNVQQTTASKPVSIIQPTHMQPARGREFIDFSPAAYQAGSFGREFSPYGYYVSAYNGLGDQALSPEEWDGQR